VDPIAVSPSGLNPRNEAVPYAAVLFLERELDFRPCGVEEAKRDAVGYL
jgi:hypothetical protein